MSTHVKKIKVKKMKPKIYASHYIQNILIEYLRENPQNNNCYYLVKYIQQSEDSNVINNPVRNSQDLDFLRKEPYDIIPQLYNTFIPFNLINKMVSMDMELNYGDPTIGLQEDNFRLCSSDSANWYQLSEKLKVGDIVVDKGDQFSRSGQYPFLVVEHQGTKCLLGFELSGGDYERGFSDGDSINCDNEAIHPLNGRLVSLDKQ